MRIKALMLALSLAPAIGAMAGPPMHPIDKYLGDCIKKNSTTAGMNKCNSDVYAMWDKELNTVYGKLQKALKTKAGKDALVAAQKQWMKYRDENFKLQDAITDQAQKNSGGGHIFNTMGAGDKTEIVKARALELQSMLSTLEM
jgi:uncharacterized protein YecT (DUF1311 family)